MKFKRTTKHNDEKMPVKHRKVWISEKPFKYRIVWRNKIFGVDVDKGYQVCVEVLTGKGEAIWVFADMSKRLVKTLKRGIEIAERHNKIWERAILNPGIRAMSRLFGGRLPAHIPTWIELDPELTERILHPKPKYQDEDDDSDVEMVPELPPESSQACPEEVEVVVQAPPKKRGRPKGSKNKPAETPKKRGRPKGSKNKVKK